MENTVPDIKFSVDTGQLSSPATLELWPQYNKVGLTGLVDSLGLGSRLSITLVKKSAKKAGDMASCSSCK